MKNRIGAMLLALPVTAGGLSLFTGRTQASANSAPAYWTGSDGSGVVAVYEGGECPIEVKNETLTFRIPDLPLQTMEGYASTVTAEYELYNPTEHDVELTLLFPIGFRPEYYDVYRENGTLLPGAEAYSVSRTAGGETQAADVTFRHTYSGSRSYDFGKIQMTRLAQQLPSDSYAADAFFQRDMRVTRYSYTVTAPADSGYYTFCFIYDCDRLRTRVFCEDGKTGATGDGRGIAYAFLSAGETREITFYAVGEQIPQANIETKLCVGVGNYSERAEGGSVSVLTESTQSFAEFVESFRPDEQTEYGGVSEMDWYNAVVAMLSNEESGTLFLSDDLPIMDYLMLWCEYTLTISAGETVLNAVTSPLYPGIEGSTPDYTYEYMLSPALYWADFGAITIRVETPYYLTGSTLQFTQQEDGYVYTKSSLPMCDLSFTIRESADTIVSFNPYDNIAPTIVTALILLGAVVVIAVVIAVVAVHVQRRNRRMLIEQLDRGRVQEGHIDLPEDRNKGDHDGTA